MRLVTAKLLLVLLGLGIGFGSAIQLARYPARLRANLGREEYTELIFSQNGKTLVGAKMVGEREPMIIFPFPGRNGPVSFQVWDVAAGRGTRTLNTEMARVFHVAPSPNGRFLAATHPGGLKLWDLVTGQERTRLQEGDWGWGSELRFSGDSRLLAVPVDAKSIWLFDTTTGNRLATISAQMPTLAFAPDSQSVAFANANDGPASVDLSLWDVKTKQRTQLVVHSCQANSVVFSGDGKMLAAAWLTEQKTAEIELWDVNTLRRLATFSPASDEEGVGSLIFSPDSRLLVVVGHHEESVWDVGLLPPQKVLDLEGVPLFSRDGGLMLDVDLENGRVQTWETATLRKCAVMVWKKGDAKHATVDLQSQEVSREGRLFAVVALNLETRTNPLKEWFERHVTYLPDESRYTELWDTMTGKQLASFNGRGFLSPDGRTLLTVSPENDLKLWDLPPRRPVEYKLGLALSAFLLLLFPSRWCFNKIRRRGRLDPRFLASLLLVVAVWSVPHLRAQATCGGRIPDAQARRLFTFACRLSVL
jgi:WD40 repeat protein